MSLYISSLNSGSNGNCYYIGNSSEAVLIDAGLTCRETERRLARTGLSVKNIKAVFISHEHSDHIKGAEVIARKYRIPLYISEMAHKQSRIRLDQEFVIPLQAYEHVRIGSLFINAFPKQHDAIDPYSFTVTCEDVTVGVFTDIGSACEHVVKNFRLCHAAFLEANYDEVMLENGNYPAYLKKRIRSDYGHLSNRQAHELFRDHKSSFLGLLLLSHLSQDNNDPEIVHDLFTKNAGGTRIAIASRHQESEIFFISGEDSVEPGKIKARPPVPAQLSLF
jgi:phosphoribosyl 1,2-cyclic phosphodiesterase